MAAANSSIAAGTALLANVGAALQPPQQPYDAVIAAPNDIFPFVHAWR